VSAWTLSTHVREPVALQWALGYMAASGLIGLAVTYYFDDPANEKLNTILKVGLQLVGLAMISLSSAAPEVSVGAAAALALSHVVHLPRCVMLMACRLCEGSPPLVTLAMYIVSHAGLLR